MIMGINLLSVGICITHTIANCAIAGHTKYTAVIMATRRAPPAGNPTHNVGAINETNNVTAAAVHIIRIVIVYVVVLEVRRAKVYFFLE